MSDLTQTTRLTVSEFLARTRPALRRDAYGALWEADVPMEIRDLVAAVREAAGWKLGFEWSDRQGEYEARNLEIYGYSLSPQPLAVLQIRRTERHRYGTDVRKAYALVGVDEGEQVFSHPLPTSPRRMQDLATATPQDVVAWAESKIFGVPVARLGDVIRQGDVAIIPVRVIPGGAARLAEGQSLHEWTLARSHTVVVDGAIWAHPDGLCARGLVEIVHARDQHHAVSYEGRCRIVVGSRGSDPWWIDAALGD